MLWIITYHVTYNGWNHPSRHLCASSDVCWWTQPWGAAINILRRVWRSPCNACLLLLLLLLTLLLLLELVLLVVDS